MLLAYAVGLASLSLCIVSASLCRVQCMYSILRRCRDPSGNNKGRCRGPFCTFKAAIVFGEGAENAGVQPLPQQLPLSQSSQQQHESKTSGWGAFQQFLPVTPLPLAPVSTPPVGLQPLLPTAAAMLTRAKLPVDASPSRVLHIPEGNLDAACVGRPV